MLILLEEGCGEAGVMDSGEGNGGNMESVTVFTHGCGEVMGKDLSGNSFFSRTVLLKATACYKQEEGVL